MPAKSEYKYGFKANAERLGEQYRAKLGISKFDPLDAFNLAEHLEVGIFSIDDFSSHLPVDQLDRLKDPDHFSAMWMLTSDGKKIILHNNYHSEKRQQSNLMHELAHIILNHEISEEAANLCAQFGLHYFNKEQELEAKFLGGCLQITKVGLLWAIKRKTIEDISNYYNASIDMVQFRLNTTGILRQNTVLSKNS